MRQTHLAGDKLFVDYAGQTMPVIERTTGEVRQAQIFIGVLGASNYTYAEATWTQSLPEWIGAHTRAFAFFGGVPNIVVPDNLKSGVTRAHRYEPDLNPTYQDMATHYGIAVVPARVRKPRDKAKVEVGVQIVERSILAVLRHRQFFSLAELNTAIAELLTRLNQRPFKKLPGSRHSQFDAIDRPALNRLPSNAYEYAEWKHARVHIDYHIEVERHYYSVPHHLIKRQLDVRITASTIECFHKGQRVACHRRVNQPGRHTTVTAHMPESHQHHAQFSPERLQRWAARIGPHTAALITQALAERARPELAYRACLGILRLAKSYGDQRLDDACQRALILGTHRYKSIASILKKGLDQQSLKQSAEPLLPSDHDNLRGPDYYH
jgi:transposase